MSEELSAAESKFVNEYARTLLVQWCHQTLLFGQITDPQIGDGHLTYFEFAQGKSWVSKKEPYKVLSGGFTTAAGFLKR